ncbi:MAG: LytTR family DNA-binding domain-containing protein [Bacteroidota bacterium]
MISYCIVDDEPIAHRIIEGYCADLPHLKKVGNAFNAFEAADLVAKKRVDLIFLDINMPKMTGFEWLKTLRQPPKIIVTTAYQEYALEGYALDVVDYLLKPFSLPRFLQAVNKVTDSNQAEVVQPANTASDEKRSLFLKGDKKYHQVTLGDIQYVEAFGNYCKVHLANEMILIHEKISGIEGILASDNFLRIHKSFVVAIDKIRLIQGNVIQLLDKEIPIGQTYKARVTKMINNKYG